MQKRFLVIIAVLLFTMLIGIGAALATTVPYPTIVPFDEQTNMEWYDGILTVGELTAMQNAGQSLLVDVFLPQGIGVGIYQNDIQSGFWINIRIRDSFGSGQAVTIPITQQDIENGKITATFNPEYTKSNLQMDTEYYLEASIIVDEIVQSELSWPAYFYYVSNVEPVTIPVNIFPTIEGYGFCLNNVSDFSLDTLYGEVFKDGQPYPSYAAPLIMQFNKGTVNGNEEYRADVSEDIMNGQYTIKVYTAGDLANQLYTADFNMEPMVHITQPYLNGFSDVQDIEIGGYISNFNSTETNQLYLTLNGTTQDITSALTTSGTFTWSVNLQEGENQFSVMLNYYYPETGARTNSQYGMINYYSYNMCYINVTSPMQGESVSGHYLYVTGYVSGQPDRFGARIANYNDMSNPIVVPGIDISSINEDGSFNFTIDLSSLGQEFTQQGEYELELFAGNGASSDTNYYISYFVTPMVSDTATLYFDPPYGMMMPGESVDVSLMVNNARDLYGADIELTFNPSVVHAVYDSLVIGDVVSGLTVDSYTYCDNDAGLIRIVTARRGDEYPQGFYGEGKILSVTFEAVNIGMSNIGFGDVSLSDSGSIPALYTLLPGYIHVIGGISVYGSLNLQGVRDYAGGVEVKLINEVGDEIASTTTDYYGYYHFYEDENGQYLQPGNYQVVASKPVYLTQISDCFTVDGSYGYNYTSDSGSSGGGGGYGYVNVPNIKLLSGDISLNNVVEFIDLYMLSDLYGQSFECSNQEEWTPPADLNRDNKVNLFDLVLLARNFNSQGYGVMQ